MARVKRGTTVKAKHKKVLKMAKGYRERNSTAYTVAKQRVEKGLQYAYRDRRKKKSDFRALWIQRINAGTREFGLTYSKFMSGLRMLGLELDRKMLANLAMNEPSTFKTIVEKVKGSFKKSA